MYSRNFVQPRRQRNQNRRNRQQSRRSAVVSNRRNDGQSYSNTSTRPKFFQAPSTLFFRGIGMPDRFETTLIFKEDTYHFSGSIAPSAQVWNCNSCFDPDKTGGGTQPNYYDQLTAIYSEYFVKQFWYELDINNQSTTITANYVAVVADTDVSSLNVENLAESKYAISGIIGPTGSVSTKKLRIPIVTIRHLFGQPVPESDSTLFAPVTASATDGASSINLYVNVKLFYRVIFKGLVLPTES